MKILRTSKKYCDYNIELRWKLEYLNKPPMIGLWSRPSRDPLYMASTQSRDGLLFASVECKHRITREVTTVARCPAHEYVQHRWIAAAMAPVNPGNGIRLEGAIQGMSLVSIDKKIHIHLDGKILEEPMLERSNNYA